MYLLEGQLSEIQKMDGDWSWEKGTGLKGSSNQQARLEGSLEDSMMVNRVAQAEGGEKG